MSLDCFSVNIMHQQIVHQLREAISKSILILALLSLISSWSVGQTAGSTSSTAAARPVKRLASRKPSAAEIHFAAFEFKWPSLGPHPGFFPIEGEPSRGFRYFVRATLYGEEAIATAKFEAVDEVDQVIQQLLLERQPDASGRSGFFGAMTVPDRPFRVVLSGEGVNGRRYRRAYQRLFRPINRPQQFPIRPGVSAAEAKAMEQLTEAMTQKSIAEMEKDLRETGGVIVMPRTRVSNVMYAPYLSKAGRPLGVRISFDVEFSQDGYYNPELHLVPDYKRHDWRRLIEMKALTGSIEPQPVETGSGPQTQPHLLAFGAGYLYRGRTTYHFTAELVPDYVVQNEKKTKFCIFRQKYKDSPSMQAAWRNILRSKVLTKYTLSIDNTDFSGEIQGLHPQGTLFKSFVAEGAPDCGEQPTNRF